jgi:AsmA protein
VKLVKRLLLGLTILAVLLIGGVFLALNLIDPNDYRDKIQSVAMEQTGRALAIDGDIKLNYFPWAGFTLGQTSLANAEGFGDAPFAKIDSAQLKVKLLPLFKKAVIVDTVQLAGLSLDLQRAADGSTNWDDLVKGDTNSGTDTATGNTEETQPEEPATGGSLQDLSIGSVIIENAEIQWRDQQNNTDATLTQFNLQSDEIALGKPFSFATDFAVNSTSASVAANVDGSGQINVDLDNQRYRLSALKLATSASGDAVPVQDFSLNLNGDVDADLNAQTVSVTSLMIDTIGVQLNGDVQITQLNSEPAISAQLKSNTVNPRQLAQKLDIELPASQDPQALTAATIDVALTANAGANATSAKLEKLSIVLDDTTIDGQATLANLAAPVPPVVFQLNVDAIDIDRYLPAATDAPDAVTETQDTGVESANTGNANAGDTPIALPIELMRQLNVDGMIRVGRLKFSNMNSEQIEVPVKAQQGVVSLDGFSASMYEGAIQTTASVDVNGSAPVYQVKSGIKNVQAGLMLEDMLQDTAPISGEAVITSNLSTSGDTLNQLISNLNGRYTSDFTDGALHGINIGYQLRRARSLFSNANDIDQEPVSKTDFSALHVSADINNGVIRSDDLDIRAPALRVAGNGVVDLPQEQIDYTVTTKVVGSVEGQGGQDLDDLKGVSASIPIRGTFEQLSTDFAGTIFAAMKQDFANSAKDAAKARAREERDRLKAEAQAKADAARREAEQKLQAEQARAEERAREELAVHKEKAEQAADEIKERAKDKLKSLFK